MITFTINDTSFTLQSNGEVDIAGDTTDEEAILEALKFLSRPEGGREWWTFMLISKITELLGEKSGEHAAYLVYPSNPTRNRNPRNLDFVDWLRSEKLIGKASVQAVTMAKSKIWNKWTGGIDSLEAHLVVEMLREGKSWADIKAAIKK